MFFNRASSGWNNMKCKKCGEWRGTKGYIIADDLENPQLYCKKCWEELKLEVFIKLAKLNEK